MIRYIKSLAVVVALVSLSCFGASPADIAVFRDARFGLFIHWGLYSQLGGRWKGQQTDYIGEWIQSRFRIPNTEYSRVATTFNPVRFNAESWIRQAKDAGMEYMVFTAKHHDGFAMFRTSASDFNIVDATPFGRDVLAELVAACRRCGMKVGLYYSHALDWHEFDASDPRDGSKSRNALANMGMPWGNSWDWPDNSNKNFDRYLKAKVYPQIRELLTNYGEIFVLWFDCPLGMTPKQSKELKDFALSIQPHVLVSGRIGNGYGDFHTPGDNQLVVGKAGDAVECPITLNDTWGFKYDDHNWKSAYSVACDLMGTVSGDANLLLNVGARPDGRFPDVSSDVLAELAAWRRKTDIQIKGAKASPFRQAMPWGWCTVADGNILQFAVRNDWTNNLEVCGIRNKILSCSVPFEREGELLRIFLPAVDDTMPRIVKVAVDGLPDIDGRIMPQNGELTLHPSFAERIVAADGTSASGGNSCMVTKRGFFTNWHHIGDSIVWKAYFPKPGLYDVWLRTETWAHSRPWNGDRRVAVRVGQSDVVADLRKDVPLPHTAYDRAESFLGTVSVSAAGELEIKVMTVSAGAEAQYYDLSALRLSEKLNHVVKPLNVKSNRRN